MVDTVAHLDDLLCAIDHVVVPTGSRVDLEVGPNDGLLEKQACKDLLHDFVLHIEDLGKSEELITVLSLVSELRHLLLESTRLNVPRLQ